VAERAWVQMSKTMTAAPPPVPIPERPRGLLALDIDGTLLGPGGVLSERTREAVYAAGEAGWLVTLATGRRWGSTKPVADALGLRVPLITFNGALVRNAQSGEIIHYRPLLSESIAPFVTALVERGLQPVLYEDIRTGEGFLTGPADYDSEAIRGWFASLGEEYGPPITRMTHDDLARLGGAIRIIVYDATERVRWVDALARELGFTAHTIFYQVERFNALMAELTHPECTKAFAIAALAEHYGLPVAQTIAVGDGPNDLEMIEQAGIGVAMGQSIPAIIERAALTIGDHANDGLAEFIERELLGGSGFPEHLRARK
jgi:5-amino-6-(5-phospho-D-ribitylamino)uracil phosphatase